MSELPDFRDIHAESAKRLADIANDAGSIFDDKTNIERAIDIVLRLQRKSARLHQARQAGKPSRFGSRQFTDVAKYRDSRRTTARAGTDQHIVAIAIPPCTAAFFAVKADCVSCAIDAGEEIAARHQNR